MIKVIIFDLGGVIFSFDGGGYEAREKLAFLFNLDKERLHNLWFQRYKRDLILGIKNEEDYLTDIIKTFNLKTSLKELNRIIENFNTVDESMIELVKKLKENYLLVVLNNESKGWNQYRIKKFYLNDYFELIFSSSDVGLAKPDKKIYKLVLNNLKGINPSEVLFIDNREENLPPAEELGIKTILFKNKNSLIKELGKFGILF